MSDGRKCSVYLPNERKLELNLQSKLLGKDLLEIVASHFKLKEREYFGIAYKHEGGYYAWLQDEKKVLEHDIARKSGKVIDLLFAVKFYVESISYLKQSRTVELFFLYVKSLVYKGQLEIEDSKTAFRLASHILQAICGDYVDDDTARCQMTKFPLFPSRLFRELSRQHCESSVIEMYKELRGFSKGKAIISYMTLVETLPAYGIHYYKVKDKSGVPWWLGLSCKGIQQFHITDRRLATKTFHWRHLENLYFREKKFSIEVNDRQPRINSVGSRDHLSTENSRKSSSEIKVHAWYGSPTLIKTIWSMSISQHHYYLDRKQSKTKLTAANNLTNLSNDLTSNSQSLITPLKETPGMTRKQIKDLDITVKKGSKDETPEVRAAKQEMSDALKSRKTKLEDQLYDKVQELKLWCLKEAEITGKLAPEYVKYMDLDEKRPKIKKRVGAEFKVKLRNKVNSRNNLEKDYPSTVTAASSSSSGFGSETADASDELSQLETEFEILTQIASAAKKLACDRTAKGRIRNKRQTSYKKSCEKLQEVENRINVLRKKCGQKPSDRASMLIDDSTDMIFEDGVGSFRDGTESERSSLSEGLLLDDDVSLSSGGDALSTHSTPAILNQHHVPPHPNSAMVSRRNRSPADVDINEVLAMKRSITPPPSFERTEKSKNLHLHPHRHQLPPSPAKIVPEEMKVLQKPQQRNWMRWDYPTKSRSKKDWNESSLDSIETTSTASRFSEDARSPEHYRDISPSHSLTGSKIKLTQPLDPSLPQKVDLSSHFVDFDGRLSANSNQNNHNSRVSASTENISDPFSMVKLRREVSDTALSELSTKSTPIVSSPTEQDVTKDKESRLPKIEESSLHPPDPDRFRKRSSSFTESTNKPTSAPHRPNIRKKPSYDKGAKPKSQGVEPRQYDAYNVPQAARLSPEVSRSAQQGQDGKDLQPTLFGTNLDIRMQYLTRSSGQLSLSAPVNPAWTQATGNQNLRPVLNRQLSGPTTVHHQVQKPPAGFGRNGPPVYPEQYTKAGYQGYVVYRGEMNPQGYDPYNENQEPAMSSSHRDYFNNAVYQDIGMGWVPSLFEYSSRASVCESASAQSKKEDIRRILQDHIATKKHPSTSTSFHGDLGVDELAERTKLSHSNSEHTWADYQKQLLSGGKTPSVQGSIASQTDSVNSRANIFQHKSPPNHAEKPPKQEPSLLPYQTQRQPRLQHQKSVPVTAPDVHHQHQQQRTYYNTVQSHARSNQPHDAKQRQLLRHYLHHDAGDPVDHVRNHVSGQGSDVGGLPQQRGRSVMYGLSAVPAEASSRPTTQRWHSDDARLLPSNAPQTTQQAKDSGFKDPKRGNPGLFRGTETPDKSSDPDKDTVVIQQLTMSPEGHAVSAFTVAKSAPNTPLQKMQGGQTFFGDSSDDDSDLEDDSFSDGGGGDTGTLKSTHRHKSADDLLSASRDVSDDVKVTKTPTIIVHTPSFKNRIKPTLVPLGSIDIDRTNQRPIRDEERSRGRQKSRHQDSDAPMPPPRVKRALSRSRKAAETNKPATTATKATLSKPTKRSSQAQIPNRGKDVNSNEIHTLKQPPASSKYSPVRTSPKHVDSSRWGTPSPPGAVFASGTLPRASKSRRKPPPSSGTPARAHLTLDVASATSSREKKTRRNSFIGRYLQDPNPASAPTTPTGSPRKSTFSPRRSPFPGPIIPARLSSHHRSKSEAWKIGANGVPMPITHQSTYASETLPHPHHTHLQNEYYSQYAPSNHQFHTLESANRDNGWRYRTEAELYERGRQRQRHQFSASAEDLLWNDNHDNQAGTLV